LCYAVYRASIELAKERGPFPLFDRIKYTLGKFVQTLPKDIIGDIQKYGIRNALLMSIAPTGTISLLAGNVSSGIEPVFLHNYERKVLGPDGTKKTYEVYDYGYLQYHEVTSPHSPIGSIEVPEYFVTAKDLTVDQHLEMQAAAQEFVDSAISKTINCPTEMSFEDFKEVYTKAYKLGLKGCTTYRPDPRSERGEVLSEKKEAPIVPLEKVPMQEVLDGRRYRIKWPLSDNALYININDYIDQKGQRRPFEIFINSKNSEHEEWIKALSLLITAIFRREVDSSFIIEELKQVCSARGGTWYKQKYVNSLVAAVGFTIEEHFRWLELIPPEQDVFKLPENLEGKFQVTDSTNLHGTKCTKCGGFTVIKQSSCWVCINCGDSKCG